MEVGDELLKRRHHLPHWQAGGSVYFVTFRSIRGDLPDAARRQVMANVLYDHGKRYDLHVRVVMPEHVHLLLRPREIRPGCWHDLADILKGIKGTSARRINQILGTSGSVWQAESYDRIVRDEAEYRETWRYISNNPFKAGLVADPDEYEFFVRP